MFQPQLSPREVEVIQLIAEGLTDKEIAARLQVTPRTVSEHINNIRDKLGASNRTSAVYRYFFQALGQRKRPTATASVPYTKIMTPRTEIILRPPVPNKDVSEIAPVTYQIFMSTRFGSGSFFNVITEKMIEEQLAEAVADPHQRLQIATNSYETVLGYSQLNFNESGDTSNCSLKLIVQHDQRNQGVGSELYEEAVAFCAHKGTKRLAAAVAEHDRAALRFAFKRGFVQTAQHLAFEMDLTRFDASRFDGLSDFVGQAGIRITSVAEFGNSEDARRKLFQVNAWCATLDLPGVKDEPAWESFEQFNEAVCGSGWYQPTGQIVAIDTNTNEWIGLAATTVNTNGASNLHTGVDRRYRHKPPIGQALKLASIQYAKRKGATRLRDDIDSRDATNLSINYMMGYEIKAGIVYLEKMLIP